MKNLLLTLTLLLIINVANATDRIVHELGLGGAYKSIQLAINAASNGDRILVYPRSNGNGYLGSLNIRESLQILSAVENEKYKIQGNVILNGTILLMGATINGNISDISYATPHHIVGCRINGNIIQSKTPGGNIRPLYVDNDSIFGSVSIIFGRISGCYILCNNTISQGISITSSVATNDTNMIVGNQIVMTGNGAQIAVYHNCNTQYFNISNNLIKFTVSSVSDALRIAEIKAVGSIYNSILNNTIWVTSTITNGIVIEPGGNYDLRNNVLIAGNFSDYTLRFNNPGTSNIISNYNYSNINSVSAGFYGSSNNFQTINTSINSDGTLASGSEPINGGDPSLDMLDLDLTRNDAGCYGGSLSLANFITPETGSRVLFVNAPRFIYTGQPATISGEGVDK